MIRKGSKEKKLLFTKFNTNLILALQPFQVQMTCQHISNLQCLAAVSRNDFIFFGFLLFVFFFLVYKISLPDWHLVFNSCAGFQLLMDSLTWELGRSLRNFLFNFRNFILIKLLAFICFLFINSLTMDALNTLNNTGQIYVDLANVGKENIEAQVC